MSSLYVWLKFLHLLGLGVFLMGHGVSGAASIAIRGRPLDAMSRALLQLSIRSHAVTFPGLLLLVVTGVWMGFLGSWWRSGWIWTGIALLVVLSVAMGAMSGAYHKARESKDVSQADPPADVVLPRTRPLALLVVGVIGLVAILFLMVFKPF